MSHVLTGVVVPPDTTRETAHEAVDPLLAPFYEGASDDGWWDWWCVGGRFTGRYSEYDAQQDQANYETCWLCHGTGERADGLSGPGNCNGCCKGHGDLTGTGRSLLHPPKWKPCPDDVVPVKVLVNNPGVGLPPRIVFPDGTCSDEGPWSDGDERKAWNIAMAERLSEYLDMALVVVDCHV